MTRETERTLDAKAAEFAAEHGISEDKAREILATQGSEGIEGALRNLAHFLKAPS
jgi:hypothetical protein